MILTLESATSTIMPNGTRLSKVFGTMMPTVHQLSLDCPLLAKSTLVKYCKYCKYCMNSLANPKSTLVQYCKYYTDRLDTPKSTSVEYCKYCANNPKSILCSIASIIHTDWTLSTLLQVLYEQSEKYLVQSPNF